jgi:hypothetical protein
MVAGTFAEAADKAPANSKSTAKKTAFAGFKSMLKKK